MATSDDLHRELLEMSIHSEAGLLARTLDWIKARCIRDNELAGLSHDDLGLLASDLGLSEADLRGVLPVVTDHSDLMDQMMRARGLDPDDVRRSFSNLVRSMEVACTRCADVRTCRGELAAGTAAAHCHEFCVNAEEMDELIEART
jgi:Family of unknown function (DUF6455)